MSRRAVVLAGGAGKRLRPYTTVLPKPLMPLGEYPILEIIIRQLASQGFDRITLAVNHQAEIVKAFFGEGERWNVRIDYSLESQPLGTMGPLRLISDLPENFIVMNGDVLTDLDFGVFLDRHTAEGNLFTIAAYQRENQVDYGVLVLDGANRLRDFMEKPVHRYNVSMGVYALNCAVLEFIPPAQLFGFDMLMLDLLQRQKPVAVRPYSGYWLDIGRPDDYMKAVDEFEQMRDRFLKS
jgi:NDP-mannose synthase